MEVKLLFSTADGISRKSWTRKHTFIRRTQYSNKLWDIGSHDGATDTWVIDLIPFGMIHPGHMFQVNELVFTSDLKTCYHKTDNAVIFSEPMNRYILRRFAWWADEDVATYNHWSDVERLVTVPEEYGGEPRNMYDPDDDYVIYCDDIGCHCISEDDLWCDEDECCYYHIENHHQQDPDCIVGWHKSSEYGWNQDLRETLSLSSKAGMGMEIEKNLFDIEYSDGRVGAASERGDWVGEDILFQGYECDSSCGVEAITNVMPLAPEHFDTMVTHFQRNRLIFDSPSDNSCGGHMHISYEGLNAGQLLAKFKPYMGILYAMFPDRLTDTHCSGNPRLTHAADTQYSGGFVTMRLLRNRVEFRLPTGVQSYQDFILRYQIMMYFVNYAVDGVDIGTLLARLRPLVKEWLTIVGDERGIEKYVRQVQGFNTWIQTGESSDWIVRYTNRSAGNHSSIDAARNTAMARIRAGNGRVADFSLITDRQSDLLSDEGCDMSPNEPSTDAHHYDEETIMSLSLPQFERRRETQLALVANGVPITDAVQHELDSHLYILERLRLRDENASRTNVSQATMNQAADAIMSSITATNTTAARIHDTLERDGLQPAGRCEDNDRENTREFLLDHPWLSNQEVTNNELDRYVANGHRPIYTDPSNVRNEFTTLDVAIESGNITGELLNQLTRRRDALAAVLRNTVSIQ